MDVKCPVCKEPWDNDELHESDFGLTYQEAAKAFRTKGCSAVWETTCTPANDNESALLGELYDLLGDDMDGAASMIEDAEFMGLLS